LRCCASVFSTDTPHGRPAGVTVAPSLTLDALRSGRAVRVPLHRRRAP
jgi:hypothetical protein